MKRSVAKVPDKAAELRQSAADEVDQKNILANAAHLTRCVNPYALPGHTVILREGVDYKVWSNGKLVFHYGSNGLVCYICGDWAEVLGAEADEVRARASLRKLQNEVRAYKNEAAKSRFVTCH